MGIIIFNEKSSLDYHILVEHPPGYEVPERDIESVHVPGRNGDIIFDKGSFKNVKRSYEIAVGSLKEPFSVLANRIGEWLYTTTYYSRLEDSYEPEFYRLAHYSDPYDISNIEFHAGRTTIEFDCKPQRFLKSGEREIKNVSSGFILKNPTNFPASPIIKFKTPSNTTTVGTMNVGDYNISVKGVASANLILDSSIQDAYDATRNLNPYVTLSKGFPLLVPGKNTITFSNLTNVEIIPNWWTI